MAKFDKAALDELLARQGLNAGEPDAQIIGCGNKRGFLNAKLTVGMRDPEIKKHYKNAF